MEFTFSSSESEDQELEDAEMEFQKSVHTRALESGVTAFILHDTLKSKGLVACSIRNNISSAKPSAVSYALNLACGGEPI